MAKINRYCALSALSGLIAALAYSYSSLGFLFFISLVPLFWSLVHIDSAHRNKFSVFWYGFVAGMVYFLFSFRWFLSLYPLDGLGINSHFVSLILVIILWLFIAMLMSVFWGLFAITFCYLKNRSDKKIFILGILLAPALFVLIDYMRPFAIGVISYSSRGLLGPHWTLGNPAYALFNNSLILALSSWIGIYGVLFVLVLINFLILSFALNKRYKSLLIVSVATVVLVIVGQAWQRLGTGERTISFSVIQTDQSYNLENSSANSLNSFKKELELLDRVLKDSPESKVIIFPEGSNFFKNISSFLTPVKVKNYFTNLAKDPKLIIDNSRVSLSSDLAYSRILFLNSQQDIIGYYDKKLLTPGGEYLPTFIDFIAGLVAPNNKDLFESLFAYTTGKDQKLATFENSTFRAAACSDFLSPDIFRDQAEDADAVIGLASTAIFHGSDALVFQNLAINKFRAAENNTSFILAANSGRSYVLDNRGNITKITADSSPQLLTGTVAIGARKSWYNKVGDWPVLLASLVIILTALVLGKNSYRMTL